MNISPGLALKTNMFTRKDNGLLHAVLSVNERYTQVQITMPGGLQSAYGLPTSTYDSEAFIEDYLPLDMGEMRLPPQYRPPALHERWYPQPEADYDASRGESPAGVTIG